MFVFSLWAGLAVLLAGCATHRVDWKTRIGHYTYDRAVLDMGPPDKKETLKDGTVVAEWLTREGRNYQTVITEPVYPYYGYLGGGYPAFTINHYAPGAWLRLVFDPDGKLRDWKRFYK